MEKKGKEKEKEKGRRRRSRRKYEGGFLEGVRAMEANSKMS